MDLRKRTQQLWRAYLMAEEPEALSQVLEWIDADCVVIGTGRHEYYTTLQQLIDALGKEIAERKMVHLKIVDEWYAQRELGPEVCLVYGGLHLSVVQTGETCADMDTRFSMVYQKFGEDWRVVHLHQSMPDLEQQDGEYYPKTLTKQVKEAQKLAEHMRRLAREDSLTGLLNHRSFFEEGARYVEQGGSFWCFVLDLDNFKQVNDNHGHLAGDEVLRRVATVLRSSVRGQDLVGRVGGDEFAILCSGPQGEDEIAAVARRILTMVAREMNFNFVWPGMSIGIARVYGSEDLRDAFRRADKALYQVKGNEKNGFSIERVD